MKLLVFVSCLLFTSQLFSQIQKTDTPKLIKIGEAKRALFSIAELDYSISGADTIYSITFDNAKYTEIKDVQTITFKETGEVLNSLYQILIEAVDADKGKENTFKLGTEDVMITTGKTMGAKYIYFTIVKSGAFFNLSKKEINKLFGK